MSNQTDDEQRRLEFYELALKCKQFLKDHEVETLTDTMTGHMATFIQRERDALLKPPNSTGLNPSAVDSPEIRSTGDDELDKILIDFMYGFNVSQDISEATAQAKQAIHRYAQKMVIEAVRHQEKLRHAVKVGHWESTCGNCHKSLVKSDEDSLNCSQCGFSMDYFTTDYLNEVELCKSVWPNLEYLPVFLGADRITSIEKEIDNI